MFTRKESLLLFAALGAVLLFCPAADARIFGRRKANRAVQYTPSVASCPDGQCQQQTFAPNGGDPEMAAYIATLNVAPSAKLSIATTLPATSVPATSVQVAVAAVAEAEAALEAARAIEARARVEQAREAARQRLELQNQIDDLTARKVALEPAKE